MSFLQKMVRKPKKLDMMRRDLYILHVPVLLHITPNSNAGVWVGVYIRNIDNLIRKNPARAIPSGCGRSAEALSPWESDPKP